MSDSWSVEVRVDGEIILVLSDSVISGVPNSQDYAREIRTAAENLLAFIGPEKPSEWIDPDSCDPKD